MQRLACSPRRFRGSPAVPVAQAVSAGSRLAIRGSSIYRGNAARRGDSRARMAAHRRAPCRRSAHGGWTDRVAASRERQRDRYDGRDLVCRGPAARASYPGERAPLGCRRRHGSVTRARRRREASGRGRRQLGHPTGRRSPTEAAATARRVRNRRRDGRRIRRAFWEAPFSPSKSCAACSLFAWCCLAMVTSLIAATVALIALPDKTTYVIPAYRSSGCIMAFALVCGPLLGLISVGYVRAIAWADRHRPRGWGRLFMAPILVLGAIGVLSITFPELLGNGRDIAQLTFADGLLAPSLTLVLALVVLRFVATVFCLASGTPGGLFTPSLAIGAPARRSLRATRGRSSGLACSLGLFALVGADCDPRVDHARPHLVGGAHDGSSRAATVRSSRRCCLAVAAATLDVADDRGAVDVRRASHGRAGRRASANPRMASWVQDRARAYRAKRLSVTLPAFGAIAPARDMRGPRSPSTPGSFSLRRLTLASCQLHTRWLSRDAGHDVMEHAFAEQWIQR